MNNKEEGLSHAAIRRRTLDMILLGSVLSFFGSILYPIVRFLNPPAQPGPVATSVKVGKLNELLKNSAKIFPFNNRPAIIVKTEKGELRAFSAVCTHLDCTVQYREDLGHIWCACHNGHYDLSGRNIAGPPPRPLEEFKVNRIADDVFVSKQT